MLRALHTIHLSVYWHIHIRHPYKISLPEKQMLGHDKWLFAFSQLLSREENAWSEEEVKNWENGVCVCVWEAEVEGQMMDCCKPKKMKI